MKQPNGAWLPEHEKEPVMLGAGFRYQGSKLDRAMEILPADRRDVALDIGSHVGLWTVQLSRLLKRVICFEPMPEHILCWYRNIEEQGVRNAMLHQFALGRESGEAMMHEDEWSSGKARINGAGTVKVEVKRLDDFHVGQVDFIKIDVEGFEQYVCEGGEETIKRERPVMIVEAKPKNAGKYGIGDDAVVRLLESWGMRVRDNKVGDYIMDWTRAE